MDNDRSRYSSAAPTGREKKSKRKTPRPSRVASTGDPETPETPKVAFGRAVEPTRSILKKSRRQKSKDLGPKEPDDEQPTAEPVIFKAKKKRKPVRQKKTEKEDWASRLSKHRTIASKIKEQSKYDLGEPTVRRKVDNSQLKEPKTTPGAEEKPERKKAEKPEEPEPEEPKKVPKKEEESKDPEEPKRKSKGSYKKEKKKKPLLKETEPESPEPLTKISSKKRVTIIDELNDSEEEVRKPSKARSLTKAKKRSQTYKKRKGKGRGKDDESEEDLTLEEDDGKNGGGEGEKKIDRSKLKENIHMKVKEKAEPVKKKLKFRPHISKTGKRLRGNIANPIQICCLFRLMGKSAVIVTWESIISIAICTYITLSLYAAFFDLHRGNVWYTLAGIDLLFSIDLIIRLLTEIYRCHTKCECTFFLIPFTIGFWIIEIIMLCPLEWFALQFEWIDTNDINQLNQLDYLRIHRIFRVFRIFKFLSLLELEQKMDEFWVFICKFFTFYILFIQLVACALYSMAKKNWLDYADEDHNIAEGSWMGSLELKKPGFVHIPFNHYILSISFSTSIVTTVGYGDLSPKVETEMLLCIVIELIGAIVMGGLFGSNLCSFLLERDGARFDLFYRVKSIEKKLRGLNSSALFEYKVKEYYDCLWNFREGVYHVQFIHYLPTSMHEDILYDICTEMFHKAILFRGLEEPFLRAVCRVVEVVLYNPDMIICQQGDYAMTMYYIIQGECLVKSKHNTNVTTAILRAGCVFGESSLFFSFPYASNVETRTCCQLLRLNKEKLMDVFHDHINILNFMRSRIQERMSELRNFYQEIGEHPITWVQFKEDVELLSLKPFANYPVELRW